MLGGQLQHVWTGPLAFTAEDTSEDSLVVQPDGTSSPASWNAGKEHCRHALASRVGIAGYKHALVKESAKLRCVDEQRLGAWGCRPAPTRRTATPVSNQASRGDCAAGGAPIAEVRVRDIAR